MFNDSYFQTKFKIEADTISMEPILTPTNPIKFNLELNKLLGFTFT